MFTVENLPYVIVIGIFIGWLLVKIIHEVLAFKFRMEVRTDFLVKTLIYLTGVIEQDYEDLIDLDLKWGTYGKGKIEAYHEKGEPLPEIKFKKLIDCDTEHLKNILISKYAQPNKKYRTTIQYILSEREKGNKDVIPQEAENEVCDCM